MVSGVLLATGAAGFARTVWAQAPAASSSAAQRRQAGTVEAIAPGQITIKSKTGDSVDLSLDASTTVLQVAPGSTDLKSAQPATMADVAVGDSVLAAGTAPADGGPKWTVRRLVLLKAAAIAQRREQEEAAWAHSLGGIVRSVDAASGTITVTSRGREIQVATGPETVVRRYAPGSVKFEDARRGTLADVHVGDQIRVRGERGGEGAAQTMRAQEIVTGSFEQLSGVLTAVNAATRQISFKDLRTKKQETVEVPAGAQVHRLSAEQAQRFALREKQRGAGGAGGQAPTAPAAGAGGPNAARGGGQDLSQVAQSLPALQLSDLKTGDAVMVVGTPAENGGGAMAITVLAGVEPILAAAPNGAEASLAPWNVGGGGSGAEQ